MLPLSVVMTHPLGIALRRSCHAIEASYQYYNMRSCYFVALGIEEQLSEFPVDYVRGKWPSYYKSLQERILPSCLY